MHLTLPLQRTAIAALLTFSAVAAVAGTIQPATYGTNAPSVLVLGPADFNGHFDDSVMFRDFSYAYPKVGEGFAPVHLPAGAVITGWSIEGCHALGGAVEARLGGVDGPVISYNSNVLQECGVHYEDYPITTVVDDQPIAVSLMVANHDGSDYLHALRIYYHLTISAAPDTPSFADVPTTHWAYQYIEASKKAGITMGCSSGGGPRYCPDGVVTRAEIAVFLARALGLSWP